MKTSTIALLSLLIARAGSQSALAQAVSSPAVLTVCEVLRNIDSWRGRVVVVVATSGYTFEGTFLKEKCNADDRVVIAGHKWLSMIAVDWTNTPLQQAAFPVEDGFLRRKRRELDKTPGTGRTTSEASRPPAQPTTIRLGTGWVAIYGRIDSPDRLKPPGVSAISTPGNGYGANGSVPARIGVIAYRSLEAVPQ